MKRRKELSFTLMLAALSSFAGEGQAFADQHTWTLDADFDEGTLVNLNHDPNHDQIQLYDGDTKPFRFINVAASGRGTVVRIDTDTGEVVGEYKTAPAPEGSQVNPSRTTVDKWGNVWTANRGHYPDAQGNSAVKIGLVVGGTRCNKDGSLNPDGDYVKLEPDKLTYNTCVDRDGDGLIRTSRKLGNILSWPDKGDGAGGAGGGDARVQDAEDECILVYQRLPDAPVPRHVSVDRENNVWVGGYPNQPSTFYKLDGETGAFLDDFDASSIGCGGYGGTIVNNNFDQILGHDYLWSASISESALLRYDPVSRTGMCIPVTASYGIGVSNEGFIWNNMFLAPGTVAKIHPNGFQEAGFPVFTGGDLGRGLAVTPKDNNVWSANSASGTVSRLDANGNLLTVIPVGNTPTGVAVDKAGKVWVTNLGSDNTMRINPATNAVDLTVDLGAGAWPYNYSDMTGIIGLSHPPIGFWDVVYDGGCNTLWNRISWSSDENPATNSAITVEIRSATTKEGLAAASFIKVENGADLSGMRGQFMEVRTSFISEAPVGQRGLPVLKDLTLEHHPLTMTVNVPDQKYSFGFQPFDLDDFISFNPAGNWFNDVIWSHSQVPDGWSVSIDDNHVATVTGPANETNDVPITFSANLSWGGEGCGVNDEAVFIANHPPVMCDAAAFQCLWSPNHNDLPSEEDDVNDDDGYRTVALKPFVCDPDGDAVDIRITSITSDEATAKKNGDKKAPDADPACIGTDTALLRAERDGSCDGRVYMVTFVASDGRGGETTMTLPVRVPHNQTGCDAVDSGQKYDATQENFALGKCKEKSKK